MKRLIDKSIYILREAYAKYKRPLLLWAGGKDSTVMLALAKWAFLDKIPFPVAFIDTGFQFRETYNFIKRIKKLWKINLIILENREAKMQRVSPKTHTKLECCTKLKTDALLNAIRDSGYDLIFEGIRWDEHRIRGKQNHFVEYLNPPHHRCYPIIHWGLDNIWQFIAKYNIPINPLYAYKIEGKVYKSIGCYPCTFPIEEKAEERAGRASTKEQLMEELRKMGYM